MSNFIFAISLVFTACNGLPGPLIIKWFLDSIGNEGLCKMLDSYQDRSAVTTAMFGLRDESGLHLFTRSRNCTIALSPRGEDFGWNPIFIPDNSDKTWGEMTIKESGAYSMRRLALEKLQEHLNQYCKH